MRNPRRFLIVLAAALALTAGSGTALAATHGRAATHVSHSATHKSHAGKSAIGSSQHSCPHAKSSGGSSSSSTGS